MRHRERKLTVIEKKQPIIRRPRKKKFGNLLPTQKLIMRVPPTSSSSKKVPPVVAWEDAVLHCLQKLKKKTKKHRDVSKIARKILSNLLHEVYSMERTPLKSQNSACNFRNEFQHSDKSKALNIVKNAVEYGESQGIISKHGQIFWFMNNSEMSPAEDVTHPICQNCRACQMIWKMKNRDVNKKGKINKPRNQYNTSIDRSLTTLYKKRRQNNEFNCKTKFPTQVKKNTSINYRKLYSK